MGRLQCPAGTYSTEVGGTKCISCPPGRYNSEVGATVCQACKGLEYQDLGGQTKCRACPSGQYWISDQTTEFDEADGYCAECPLGATCSPLGGIVPYPNYFIFTDDDRVVQARICLPGFCETCANQSYSKSDEIVPGQVFSCCTVNRPDAEANPLCGRCDSEYYLADGECIYCTETDKGLATVVVLLTWLYITVFHSTTQIPNSSDTRIFLNLMQFIFLFLVLRAGNLATWLGLFNFNFFNASSSSCVAPLTDMQRLSTGIVAPLVSYGFLILNFVIHYCVWFGYHRAGQCRYSMCTRKERRKFVEEIFSLPVSEYPQFAPIYHQYQRTTLAFLCTSYMSIVQTLLTFFS